MQIPTADDDVVDIVSKKIGYLDEIPHTPEWEQAVIRLAYCSARIGDVPEVLAYLHVLNGFATRETCNDILRTAYSRMAEIKFEQAGHLRRSHMHPESKDYDLAMTMAEQAENKAVQASQLAQGLN